MRPTVLLALIALLWLCLPACLPVTLHTHSQVHGRTPSDVMGCEQHAAAAAAAYVFLNKHLHTRRYKYNTMTGKAGERASERVGNAIYRSRLVDPTFFFFDASSPHFIPLLLLLLLFILNSNVVSSSFFLPSPFFLFFSFVYFFKELK